MVGNEQKTAFPPTVFGLLRHGTTLWNEEKRIQGSRDSALSPQGRDAVLRWCSSLARQNWQRILASDLGRAQETAEILGKSLGLPLTFDGRLQELHWGLWEGQKFDDIKRYHPKELEQQVNSGWDFRPPEGESRREALRRAKHALEDAVLRWRTQRILVVCHQGIIKCFLHDVLQTRFLPGELPDLDKNGLHILEFREGAFGCRKINLSLIVAS